MEFHRRGDHDNWGKCGGSKGLANAARRRWKYFGTASDNIYLDDEDYVKQLWNRNDFMQLTPSNTQKVQYQASKLKSKPYIYSVF